MLETALLLEMDTATMEDRYGDFLTNYEENYYMIQQSLYGLYTLRKP